MVSTSTWRSCNGPAYFLLALVVVLMVDIPMSAMSRSITVQENQDTANAGRNKISSSDDLEGAETFWTGSSSSAGRYASSILDGILPLPPVVNRYGLGSSVYQTPYASPYQYHHHYYSSSIRPPSSFPVSYGYQYPSAYGGANPYQNYPVHGGQGFGAYGNY